jgi:16S rRNA (adenine1518-N6/adenine1519-N6)-dimethyltransferase
MQTESLLTRTKKILASYDLRARKSLGQHFLVDGSVLRKIAAAAELTPEDTVVEVGPGLGVLTQLLAEHSGKVIAIELDNHLVEILKTHFHDSNKVLILNQDVLKFNPADIVDEKTAYKLVANLPYYITSAVIRYFLEMSNKPKLMVLMVQKEVAQQITAKPGDMSLLSVSVQLYGTATIFSKVSARCFYPAPAVDSAILKIEVYPQPKVQTHDIAGFFNLVRAGFSANRKQLVNSLSNGLNIPKTEIIPVLEQAGIEPRRRAESLTIDEWGTLYNVFSHRE